MIFNGRRVRELEEELSRCKRESEDLREILNSLEEGVVVFGDSGIEFVNESGRSILKEVPLEEIPSSERVRVIHRSDRFMVFSRSEPEEEKPEEAQEDKRADCVREVREQIQPLIEEVNQLSSQAVASFAELDEVFRIVSNGLEIVKEMNALSKDTEKSLVKDLQFVQELSQRSEDIVKILSLINEISEQTNMLALNAAIEAARAGELGRGFAVVAEEVRRLAGKTMEFTENIDTLLKDIDRKIETTRKHMEDVSKKAVSQMDQAGDVEELFYLVQYRMETLKSRYEEVSSRLESVMNVMKDTLRSLESVV